MKIEYRSEFGYQLVLVIPWAYELHRRGLLKSTKSVRGTESLYYFSPQHEVTSSSRRYQKAPGANSDFCSSSFDLSCWTPPPYRDIFAKEELPAAIRGTKPLLLIHNKYTREWDGPPCNFLDLETVDSLAAMLKTLYTVVYIRPSLS